ncbi:Cl- channel voltage-gated family protein [Ruminiclostridium papyrosolvens DSM 2782]|uniref:Cl- channel voltage-gated family protein n=1 Tax=Ruminiclostridium papyrosolvens DSM 2782 TaxID=588581 RepID=F1TDB3_9FIRM|nr:ClC family H(+)/Cl(-) exchange transporter [Ruminiclostridium papyrosolvens]EGD47551.1 Cl- channel voltage-gated family protein [Ruminiclostridium papyrosolvens DSM 2782]WES36503.1 ClC family H(+)/Cl(-) exchange transporter [Ruminiclostridium papyrosolvens DSM 2782]
MKEDNKHNTYNTLFHWHSFRLKLVFEGIAVGILTGLLIILYRFSLEKSMEFIKYIYGVLLIKPYLIPIWVGVLVIVGFIVGKIIKAEPMVSGSGIPQVEGVLLRKLKMSWWKVILGKFFGGVLAIGSGLSLGREGPSVQLGAAIGQGFSKIFKRIKLEEKYLITSGASAGLAAAFNAPLAGVMFALEEVHKNFSPLVLLSSLAAALSADYVSSGFFGLKPVLNFKTLNALPLKSYFYIIVLGVVLGALGGLFNKSILMFQTLYSKLRRIPKEFHIIIPMIISILLGLVLPQVLGGGHELITSLLANGGSPILFLLMLLLAKFLFTMVSYGSGAPGGIFLPLLSIGALIGSIYGFLAVYLFHFENIYINSFIILAMAGYFTAVVRAPITGIILITEMTGSFNHLLSLAIVSITAYIVADLLGSKPIYESLLERILRKQGRKVAIGSYKHKSILEFAICMGSELDGKVIKDIKWPSHCLLVAVKRGEQEIIPKGDTALYAGDYLIVLTNDDKVSKINDSFAKIIGHCE